MGKDVISNERCNYSCSVSIEISNLRMMRTVGNDINLVQAQWTDMAQSASWCVLGDYSKGVVK